MTDESYHYLIPSGSEPGDLNLQMFKIGQQPKSWAFKGMRLKRDASIFYQTSESTRLFIISELEKKNLNFVRFYRWDLEDKINEILEHNKDCFLPDFDTYYLLTHLSLENLLKAIWLDQHPTVIGFDQLPKGLKTHDLCRLSSEIDLNLSQKQSKALSKLGELFIGYSRYPIKTRVEKSTAFSNFDFGERPFGSVCIDCLENPYAEDKDVIEDLFEEQLQERLNQVYANSHEHMQSTFSFDEHQESNCNNETKE